VGIAIIIINDFYLNSGCKLFFRVDLLAGTVYIHLDNFDDNHIFEPNSRCGINKNVVGSKMMVHS